MPSPTKEANPRPRPDRPLAYSAPSPAKRPPQMAPSPELEATQHTAPTCTGSHPTVPSPDRLVTRSPQGPRPRPRCPLHAHRGQQGKAAHSHRSLPHATPPPPLRVPPSTRRSITPSTQCPLTIEATNTTPSLHEHPDPQDAHTQHPSPIDEASIPSDSRPRRDQGCHPTPLDPLSPSRARSPSTRCQATTATRSPE